jgi:hypothetical protein
MIQQFARAAIEHAQTAWTERLPCASFGVAGITIALSETEPLAVTWVPGQFDEARNEPSYRIFCDYSNWQSTQGLSLGCLAGLSPLDMDSILAEVGMKGSFYAPLNQWDLFDPDFAMGVRFQTNPSAYPEWEPTAPLAHFLNWAMRAEKRMVLHAATLGCAGRGVLIAAPGGHGKSGTTLAGVLNGLTSVGDDYCVVDLAGNITAYPFFRKMKQDQAGLERVGLKVDPSTMTGPNWQDKFVFDLRHFAPEAAVDSLAIQAILLPEITHSKTTEFRPAKALEVLRFLGPSTMKQLSGDREGVFDACAEIARRIPGVHMQLGTNPAEIAAAVGRFIREECS